MPVDHVLQLPAKMEITICQFNPGAQLNGSGGQVGIVGAEDDFIEVRAPQKLVQIVEDNGPAHREHLILNDAA